MSAAIPPDLEFAAYVKLGRRCVYCYATEGVAVHPLVPSEPADVDNVIVACAWCDAERGTSSHAEYLIALAEAAGVDVDGEGE